MDQISTKKCFDQFIASVQVVLLVVSLMVVCEMLDNERQNFCQCVPEVVVLVLVEIHKSREV